MKNLRIIVLSWCLSGAAISCASTAEGDRQLVDQVLKASALVINGVVIGPDAVQAMMDIKKNAEVLQANLGGPKEPKPYSPQASAEARQKATEQHQNPWWQSLLTSLIGIAIGGGAARALVGVFPSVFAGPVGSALKSMVEGVAKARKQAEQSPDQKLHIDKVLETLAEAQNDGDIREYVRAYAKRVESKLSQAGQTPTPPAS